MHKFTVVWGCIEDDTENFITFVEVEQNSLTLIMDACFLVEWNTEWWKDDFESFDDFRNYATYSLYAVFPGHIKPEYE